MKNNEDIEKTKNFQEKANNLNKRLEEFAEVIGWLALIVFGMWIKDDIDADIIVYIIYAIGIIGFLSSLINFIKKLQIAFLIETYALLGIAIAFGIVTIISMSQDSELVIYYLAVALIGLITGVYRLYKNKDGG